jgi:hypothetical protein
MDNNTWETYAPEEKDWGHPPHGSSPSTWERSETFKFKKSNPHCLAITVVHGSTLAQHMAQHTGMAHSLANGNTASSILLQERL